MPEPIAIDDLIRAKLPFWKTVKQAYVLTLGNIGTIITLSWKWALLMLPFQVLYFYQAYPALHETYATLGTPSPMPMPFLIYAGAMIVGLFGYLLFSKPAVGWHRFVLRQQAAESDMHFDDATWRYAGFILLIYGLYSVPGVIQQLLMPVPGEAPSTAGVLASAAAGLATIAGLVLLFRFTVILPAVAVDNQSVTLSNVYHLTRGHTFRLLFGNLLVALPFSLVVMGGSYFALTRADQMSAALLVPVATMLGYLGVFSSLAFTSLAYRFLAETSR